MVSCPLFGGFLLLFSIPGAALATQRDVILPSLLELLISANKYHNTTRRLSDFWVIQPLYWILPYTIQLFAEFGESHSHGIEETFQIFPFSSLALSILVSGSRPQTIIRFWNAGIFRERGKISIKRKGLANFNLLTLR